MIHEKVVDEISLDFPELFIIGKYVKIRFKNRRPPYQKDQKYYKNWTNETAFVYILGFLFYGVSRTKADLHNKYIFNSKKIQKDQNVSEWNHGWKTGAAKVNVLTYFHNFCQLPISALSSNECYIILLIIHWFLYINYLYMLYYLHL